MRTFFVVDDEALQSLTSISRTAALTEFKRAFDFVGQAPRQQPVTVSVIVPSAFPETFDLSDGVIRLSTSGVSTVATSMRQQSKIVAEGLRQFNIGLQIPNRISVTPEKNGQGSQLKQVTLAPSGRKVAVVLMAAEVSISEMTSSFIDSLPVTKADIEKRQNFDDANGEPDLGKMVRYFKSYRSLEDMRHLLILENPTTIAKWGSDDQQRIGVAIGRAMAHEVRHVIVANPVHAAAGLGADSPDVFDDKNYADFSVDDRSRIIATLNDLDASQSGADVIPTFPKSIRTDQNSFPF